MWPFIIPAAIGALGSVVTNAMASREAQKNRDFQAQMSDTAHQREIVDLTAAGLNPVMSANHGASSPSGSVAPVVDVGEGASRGVSSALAVRQQRASLDLLAAQTAQARASAQNTAVNTSVTQARVPLELAQLQNQISAGSAGSSMAWLNLHKSEQLLPTAIAQARAELEQMQNSARRTEALAVLDELAAPGMRNIAAVQEKLGALGAVAGEAGPSVRFLLDLARRLP